MTTSRTRALVSLAATMTITLALGACTPGASHSALDRPAPVRGQPLAIRFDNDAVEHVDVYLIGEQREWLLGRVAPGARTTLRIPEASLAGRPVFMQLAVIAGERRTLQAARDARARLSVAQPTSAILSQQWSFAEGQIMSLRLRTARAGHDRQ